MRAILVNKPGDASQLRIGEVNRPELRGDELLVRVKAAGVNRADILQRQGLYPPPAGSSSIIGLEVSGVVEERSSDCPEWNAGDKVFSLLSGGGYAEYAVIPKKMAMRIPDNLSFEEASAIPEAYFTAFQALIWIGQLTAEESVLIHAGASGVGTAAIQIARQTEAKIFTTAGSDEKVRFCAEQGAHQAINYRSQSFEKIITNETDGRGVDLIIDFIGSPYWQSNMKCMSIDGRIVILATMGGSSIPEFDLRQLMRKRLTISGSTLRNRSREYKIKLTREFSDFALSLFNTGSMKPAIDKVFSWEDVSRAHQYMEENRNKGKIVLKVT
jgi:putative PIG3 family NAD(P)H quinone oxidoreductase